MLYSVVGTDAYQVKATKNSNLLYVRGFLTHGAPAPPRLAGVLSALREVSRLFMWNNYHHETEEINMTYLKP
jgi:hypothetical protein